MVDNTEIDLDSRDGSVSISKEFMYEKEASSSGTIHFSIADLAKARATDDPKLRFSITAVIVGLVGIFICPGVAFMADGGNQALIRIGGHSDWLVGRTRIFIYIFEGCEIEFQRIF